MRFQNTRLIDDKTVYLDLLHAKTLTDIDTILKGLPDMLTQDEIISVLRRFALAFGDIQSL